MPSASPAPMSSAPNPPMSTVPALKALRSRCSITCGPPAPGPSLGQTSSGFRTSGPSVVLSWCIRLASAPVGKVACARISSGCRPQGRRSHSSFRREPVVAQMRPGHVGWTTTMAGWDQQSSVSGEKAARMGTLSPTQSPLVFQCSTPMEASSNNNSNNR